MLLSKNSCCRLRCSPFLAWALGSLSMASTAPLWLSEGTLWFTNVDLWVSSNARPHVLSFTKSSVLRKRSLMPTRNCQRRVAADQCRVDRVEERWEPSRQVIDGKVISNTNADQQATNLEILAQRQTHGAKPWEPHTWGLWDISILIINGNFEETYNWEAPRNCRIPSNELSYCQPAIVQHSRPTWVIWFSNMSLLGPWLRAVGPCVPCLDVKQEFMPQVGIINNTTPNARLNILGISWRKKKSSCLHIHFLLCGFVWK